MPTSTSSGTGAASKREEGQEASLSLPPTLGQTGHTHISMMLGTEMLRASVECRGEGLTWGSSNGAPKKEEGQAQLAQHLYSEAQRWEVRAQMGMERAGASA